MTNKWVVTTLGKKRYPIIINADNPDYEASKTDVVISEHIVERNLHQLTDVSDQIGSGKHKVFAFTSYLT